VLDAKAPDAEAPDSRRTTELIRLAHAVPPNATATNR
jgi:hypothetical protein